MYLYCFVRRGGTVAGIVPGAEGKCQAGHQTAVWMLDRSGGRRGDSPAKRSRHATHINTVARHHTRLLGQTRSCHFFFSFFYGVW